MKLRTKISLLVMTAMLTVLFAPALARQAVTVKNYFAQCSGTGCDNVLTLGGTANVPSGGIINIKTGAKLQNNGVDMDLSAGIATSTTSSTAELNYNDGEVLGTSVASKTLGLDANKATDTLRATTDFALGGTGVPGGAAVLDSIAKTVTGIADATVTDVATITIPNAKHFAQLQICVSGIMGAGGAIGAGEAGATNCYAVTIVRTAGVNAVGTVSSAFGAAAANVAGAGTVTATTALSAVSGAVGATNTFTLKITITKSGGSSANHVAFVSIRLLNGFATGITVA